VSDKPRQEQRSALIENPSKPHVCDTYATSTVVTVRRRSLGRRVMLVERLRLRVERAAATHALDPVSFWI